MSYVLILLQEICSMLTVPAGSEWLKKYYKLSRFTITHSSFIGKRDAIELTSAGNVEQVFNTRYAPVTDSPILHLEFSLKYDDLNLDFLKAVFERIPVEELVTYIESSPSGKYSRKLGYLYELLTGHRLTINKPITGNYVDLLDPRKYITGNIIKNTRWHINDNLLGTSSFCPIVRKTKKLEELLNLSIAGDIDQLKDSFSEDIFRRAINYLYGKETKSSYEIEREKPSADRMEKFINLLRLAGKNPLELLLTEQELVDLQSAIVDPRYAAKSFRDFQNYIGQTLPGGYDLKHYICPPPAFVPSLMKGLMGIAGKTAGIFPEIRAAVIAFSFVFIHPFEDGNGRLHRFLIHDILVHDGVVPHGLIIPVSAHMLNNMKDYDAILEKYSKPLMQRIKYENTDTGEVIVTNAENIEGYFRYPDLTDQCIYLIEIIHATLREDMPGELRFIQRYDETKKALQNIVDMPDKDLNLMITFLHQNKGVFPKRRREQFSKLTDEEIAAMQARFRDIFELG